MKITITGSLGNISQKLVNLLAAQGHSLTVISSNPQKAMAIKALQALPAIGSVEDAAFLSQAFGGADAVYTMIPPHYTTPDLRGYMRTVGANYARAIRESGVKWVVNLSSIGAHAANGPGPTGVNYELEKLLDALEGVHVLHLRPGMFYTNFWGSMEMIRHQGLLGNNFGDEVNLAMTHPHDIAAAAAEALHERNFPERSYRYVVSDQKTGREIAYLLGQATGKPQLRWMEFSDEALFTALVQNGLSEEMARIYIVEIGMALRKGSLLEDYRKHSGEVLGKTSFYDFAQEFGQAYRHGQ